MINIKYNRNGSYYVVNFLGLGDRIVTGKFDTGAAATIITSRKLGLSDAQLNLLKRYLEESKIPPRTFYSATDGIIAGYLVKTKDARINNIRIENFYYYLILENKLDKALLGDDFISCCTFSHMPKGDIVISAIDLKLYESTYVCKSDCMDISEVLSKK